MVMNIYSLNVLFNCLHFNTAVQTNIYQDHKNFKLRRPRGQC